LQKKGSYVFWGPKGLIFCFFWGKKGGGGLLGEKWQSNKTIMVFLSVRKKKNFLRRIQKVITGF